MTKEYGRYSAEDKAKALALYAVNDGNALRTAEELGIGLSTLNRWIDLDKQGKTSTVVLQLKQQIVAKEFANISTRIRTKALDRLEQMLDDKEQKFNPQQLATIVGILTDKLDRTNTITLTQTSTTSESVDSEQVADNLRGFLSENVEDAAQRRSVIEAEVIEQTDEVLDT